MQKVIDYDQAKSNLPALHQVTMLRTLYIVIKLDRTTT